jgi:hypothetical protein
MRVKDGDPGVQAGIDETLGNIKLLVERRSAVS